MYFTFYWVPVEPYCKVNFVNLQRRILADRINRNNRTIGKDLKKDLQIANDNLNDMSPWSRCCLHLICSGSVSSENHWARATARLVLPAATRELSINQSGESIAAAVSANEKPVSSMT